MSRIFIYYRIGAPAAQRYGRRVSDLVRQAYDKTQGRGKRALQPNSAIDWCPSRRWWMTSAGPRRSASCPSAHWWRIWAFAAMLPTFDSCSRTNLRASGRF